MVVAPSIRDPGPVKFSVGDKVVRNPATWVPSDLDAWGRGHGVGVVIEPPLHLGDSGVDVRWPCGRCFEDVAGLLPAPAAADEDPASTRAAIASQPGSGAASSPPTSGRGAGRRS
jgi:hypothetical protein